MYSVLFICLLLVTWRSRAVCEIADSGQPCVCVFVYVHVDVCAGVSMYLSMPVARMWDSQLVCLAVKQPYVRWTTHFWDGSEGWNRIQWRELVRK